MYKHIGVPFTVDLSQKKVNGKRFYTTPCGKAYPSVTTVLSHGAKPWLDEWKHMLGADKAAKETKRCSDRGTAVHTMVESYLNNIEDPVAGHDQTHRKMFNQIKLRLKPITNIRAQELAMFSDKLGLAGRVDCIAEYNGKLAIIDFKTSNNNKDVGMIEDYFIQTTAYAIMYNEMYGEPIEDLVILMGVEKGVMPLVFEDKIDKYIKPLLLKIRAYNESQGA